MALLSSLILDSTPSASRSPFDRISECSIVSSKPQENGVSRSQIGKVYADIELLHECPECLTTSI